MGWLRRRRAGRCSLWAAKFCVRLILLIVLAGAGILVYLHVQGFPDWCRARWVKHMAAQGLHVDASEIFFHPLEGVRASDFRYYDSGLRILPVLEAERVKLDIDVLDLIRGQAGLEGLTVFGGTVRVSPQGVLHLADPANVLVIEDLDATLRVSAVEILVPSLRARILDMQVHGAGAIVLRLPGEEVNASLQPLRIRPGESRPEWLGPLAEQLNAISFSDTPDLNVEFVVKPTDLAASELKVHGVGGATTARGVAFDQWELKGEYRNRRLMISRVNASLGEQSATLSGSYLLDGGLLTTRIQSSLPPHHWNSLMPIDWRDRLEAMRLFFRGAVEWDLSLGPAPIGAIWSKTSGTIRLAQAELSDIWVEEADLSFATDESTLELRDIQATLGQGPNQGTVRGGMSWDLDQKSVQGWADARLDCIALIPIMTTNQIKVVQRFQFPTVPPRSEVTFFGKVGDPFAFALNGTVTASNFFYRGSHAESGSTGISISNRVLTLEPLAVSREEGSADGLIRLDFVDKRVDLDLVSTIDPKAAARAATPVLERIFRVFEFEGPTRTVVKGEIYYRDKKRTSVQASSVTEGLNLKSFRSDHASFDVDYSNNRVKVTNIVAGIYGGEVEGTYEVHSEPGGKHQRYSVNAWAKGVSFEDVVRTVTHKDGEQYQGKIGGTLQLTGLLGENQGHQAKGGGTVRIGDGRIMRIPLFGGLSRILGKIYPGLGFSKQTDFSSDFTIEGKKIAMDEVTLEGNFFSLQGKGDYFVGTKVIDYDVEFQLLREGLVGTVVRLVTMPITKLLKFDLEGTLDQPVWRPKNLPKELFEGFENEKTDAPKAGPPIE